MFSTCNIIPCLVFFFRCNKKCLTWSPKSNRHVVITGSGWLHKYSNKFIQSVWSLIIWAARKPFRFPFQLANSAVSVPVGIYEFIYMQAIMHVIIRHDTKRGWSGWGGSTRSTHQNWTDAYAYSRTTEHRNSVGGNWRRLRSVGRNAALTTCGRGALTTRYCTLWPARRQLTIRDAKLMSNQNLNTLNRTTRTSVEYKSIFLR